MMEAKEFIKKYEKFYFKGAYSQDDLEEIGLSGIKSVREEDEEEIMKKLRVGLFDRDAMAWKLGSYRKEGVDHTNVVTGFRKHDLTDYLGFIDKNMDVLLREMAQATVCIKKQDYDGLTKVLVPIFYMLRSAGAAQGIGTVYIINTLFFLSKGEIPIYDKNVYRAIQNLYLNSFDICVDFTDAPSADNVLNAVFRLMEYMRLVDIVFGDAKTCASDCYCECVGYTSRGLDRALWVYGQLLDN